MEAKDERVWRLQTEYGEITATIADIADAQGWVYESDNATTNAEGHIISNKGAWRYYGTCVPMSYCVYVNLPSPYNNSQNLLYTPTHTVGIVYDFAPADPPDLDDLVWYGWHGPSSGDTADVELKGPRKTADGSMSLSSDGESYFRHDNSNGWTRNGLFVNYCQTISGYANYSHMTEFSRGFDKKNHPELEHYYAWDWVYPENGYYTNENQYIITGLYMASTSNQDDMKFLIGLCYQLRGHVLYDPNGGTGGTIDKIMDMNMDIIRTDTPSHNVDLTRQNPTRSGYTFLGWGTNQNAQTIYSKWQWAPLMNVQNEKNALTLYAQWMNNSITL